MGRCGGQVWRGRWCPGCGVTSGGAGTERAGDCQLAGAEDPSVGKPQAYRAWQRTRCPNTCTSDHGGSEQRPGDVLGVTSRSRPEQAGERPWCLSHSHVPVTAKGQRCCLHQEASTKSEANDLTARWGRQAAPGLGAGRGVRAAPHLGLHLPPTPSRAERQHKLEALGPRGSSGTPGWTSRRPPACVLVGTVPGDGGTASEQVCRGVCVRVHACVCTRVFVHGCACAFILHTRHQGGDLGHSPGLSWEGGVQGRLPRSQAVTSSGCLGQPQSPGQPGPGSCCGPGVRAGGLSQNSPSSGDEEACASTHLGVPTSVLGPQKGRDTCEAASGQHGELTKRFFLLKLNVAPSAHRAQSWSL